MTRVDGAIGWLFKASGMKDVHHSLVPGQESNQNEVPSDCSRRRLRCRQSRRVLLARKRKSVAFPIEADMIFQADKFI